MSNVIYVDFTANPKGVETSTRFEQFLALLREQGLDEDDILEVVDAIRDPEYYLTVDDDIKDIADAWLLDYYDGGAA